MPQKGGLTKFMRHIFHDHPLFSSVPVDPGPGVDIPARLCCEMTIRDIRNAEAARKIPHRNLEGWDAGRLQRYLNYVGMWSSSVVVPTLAWADDNGASLTTL